MHFIDTIAIIQKKTKIFPRMSLYLPEKQP